VTYSHYESSPGSSDVGQRQEATEPPTKPTDLGVESACIGCYYIVLVVVRVNIFMSGIKINVFG